MRLPEFTAEVSLYDSTASYRMAATHGPSGNRQTVAPQAWGCLAAALAGHLLCGPGCGIAAHVICEMLADEGTAW